MIKLFEFWFKIKLNRKKIIKHLKSNDFKEFNLNRNKDQTVVSAVQRQIVLVKNVEEYIESLESFIRQGAERNSYLVAFPEYNFFDLLGLIPGFKMLNRYLNKKTVSSRQSSGNGDMKFIYNIFYAISQPIQEAVELIMCLLAKKYGVYIYSGSYFIKKDGGLYNGGSLISPQGKILGTQMKLHLTDFEEKLGLRRGKELKVFELDMGRVCFPICMDATYYETFKLATNEGCHVVIIPIANNEEYNLFRALRGIWPRVQESYVYGIKPSLNGWLIGMHFTGKAGIFAPISLTDKKNGIISISKKYEGDNLITAEIDIKRLKEAKEKDEYSGDENSEFEKDYFIKTYSKHL